MRERLAAVRLYRFARAVQEAFLDENYSRVARLQLPPPFSITSDNCSAADKKLALKDPSLQTLVKSISQDRDVSDPSANGGMQRDLSLLHWWSQFGDLEIGLQRILGEVSGQPQWWARTRQPRPSSRLFEKGRLELTRPPGTPGGHAMHPIAWYVHFAATDDWSSCVDSGGVGEALGLYSKGGWQTWHDVLCEFYDAVTRAVCTRFASRTAYLASDRTPSFSGGDLARSIFESARRLAPSGQSTQRPLGEVVLSPYGTWCNEEPRVVLRVAAESCSGVVPIVMYARARAYVRSLGKRFGGRYADVIQRAELWWPEDDAFGTWLAQGMRHPTHQVAEALAAVGRFFGQSLAASSNRNKEFSEDRFLRNVQDVLTRCGVGLFATQSASRRLATSREGGGVWAIGIDEDKCTIPFGVATKATCPLPLLDAIDRYDQLAWAYATVADVSGAASWTTAKGVLSSAGGWGEEWERVKGELLDLPPEPAVREVADVLKAVRQVCLRLEEVLRRNEALDGKFNDGPNLGISARHLRDLSGVLLRLPGVNTPDATGCFGPPRIADGVHAGDVDVAKWLDDPWWYGGRSSVGAYAVEILGRRDDAAYVKEDMAAVGQAFTLSLPGATAADQSLIACPGFLIWTNSEPPPSYVKIIHEHLRPTVQHAIRHGGSIDLSAALEQLRTYFAADGGKDRFHEMVSMAAVRKDPVASACLSALRSDERFALTCFPEVSEHDGKWVLRPPSPSDTEVEFCFHEKPGNDTTKIKFATTREKAKRVVSRGPADAMGLQATAERLIQWCEVLPDSPRLKASRIMELSDRHELFGEPLDNGIEIATALLAVVVKASDAGESATLSASQCDDGFQKAQAWLDAAGVCVEPANWRCWQGVDSIPSQAHESPTDFHPHVPEGSIVVKRFRSSDQRSGSEIHPFEGHRSAGPPPAQYLELLALGRAHNAEEFLAWLQRVPGLLLKDKDDYKINIHLLYSHVSRGYHDRVMGRAPEWDLPKEFFQAAASLFEKWYEEAFECEAFPKDEYLEAYEGGVSKDEMRSVKFGEAIHPGLVQVVVKGFRTRRTKEPDQAVIVRQDSNT